MSIPYSGRGPTGRGVNLYIFGLIASVAAAFLLKIIL